MNKDDKFEVSYDKKPNREIELVNWRHKMIKRAAVKHGGSDGLLTIEFEDGMNKKYGFNELGFWEFQPFSGKSPCYQFS